MSMMCDKHIGSSMDMQLKEAEEEGRAEDRLHVHVRVI
jgi:hypothetical protein